MPNWCANTLTITATNDEQKLKLQQLNDAIEENNPDFGLFNFFIPCPSELDQTVKGYLGQDREDEHKQQLANNLEKYGYETWYEFKLDNWGTKWDANDLELVVFDGTTIVLNFETAWSPPEAFFYFLADQEYEVVAGFVEQGCNFIGHFRSGDGVMSENFIPSSFDENADNDEYWEKLSDEQDFQADRYFSIHNVMNRPYSYGG